MLVGRIVHGIVDTGCFQQFRRPHCQFGPFVSIIRRQCLHRFRVNEFFCHDDTWRAVLARDPYYNPNLTRDFPDYRLRLD